MCSTTTDFAALFGRQALEQGHHLSHGSGFSKELRFRRAEGLGGTGSQCDFPEILGAYEAVYRWVKEHDRQADGPAREIHLSGPEELRMEIAVPLR